MPVYYARANGNVNGTIWATTPTGTASNLFPSFNSADILMANSFTVTFNVNTTVQEIRNDNANGATAGGTYNLNDGVTLTAAVVAGATTCLSYGGSSPNSASIVGSITGGTTGAAIQSVSNGGSGTLNITGNVTGGTGTGATGVRMTTGGTINITGNVTGSATVGANGVVLGGVGTVNITGNVTGGGAGSTSAAVNVSGAGVVTITGTASGGVSGDGVVVGSSATVTVSRAKGNGFGNGSVGLSAAVGVNNAVQSASVRVFEIEFGDLGQSPTAGPISLVDATSNFALMYRVGTTKKTLVDNAATVDYPANSSVRSGTVFANGNRTGTCAVPAAASVALGVPVDNTTGTAALTPAAVWAYATASATTAGSMGERLANAATVASTGQQIADAVTA